MNQTLPRSSAGARTLAGEYYLAPDVYQLETDRIFRNHWLCVGLSAELTGSGAMRLVELDGESLILVRDEAGCLRCFYNVCRHRGTRLCTQTPAEPVRSISCPYHAWKYALDGQLLAAPNMQSVAGFERRKYPLHEAGVIEWLGFVLVNLSEPRASVPPWLRELEGRLAAWGIDQLRPAACLEYDVRANWKLLFQNYSECYHCPCVHPTLNALTPYKAAENDLLTGPALGGPMQLAEGVESMTRDGRACAAPLPGLAAAQRRQVYYYTLFPTMFLSPHPDYVLIHRLRRLAPDRTRITCQWLFHPDSMAAAGFDPAPAVEFWDQTNRQDWHVCELSQQGIASRAYQPGPYSDLESVVAAFDQHYLQQLGEGEFTG